MVANGENMDKRWQKETHVPGHIIGVPWQLVVQSANKYVLFFVLLEYKLND
jgi:hypothetical protein